MRLAFALVAVLLAGMTLPTSPAAAAPASELGLTKEASVTQISPGQQFQYSLTLTCSSLVQGCVDATLTDTLPAEFEVSSLPSSSSEREVTFDAATRLLTVKFRIPLSNPAGKSGLPAGQTRKIVIGMRLPAETPVADGSVIPNTADGVATNADPVTSSVDITAEIPAEPRPVGTKSWSPGNGIAQSDAESTMTLGVRNGSTGDVDVRKLTLTDTTEAVFDRFDVTSLGPVVSYPPGTNRVQVDVCTALPCTDADFINGTPQSGNGPFTPPGGVALGDITGVRFTFLDSAGKPIPYSATQGQVAVGMVLRDTLRSNGDPIQPLSNLRVTNSVTPALVDGSDNATNGTPATAIYDILPNSVQVAAAKSIYSDTNGDYDKDGRIVVGRNSGISMDLTATNTGAGKLSELSIKEPSVSTANEFAKLDITKGQFNWPTGATTAVLDVKCRSGAQPSPVTFTKAASPQLISNFGCASGVYPEEITLTYKSPAGTAAIASKASGMLQLHGIAARVDQQDVKDNLQNAFDVEGVTPSATGSAIGTANVRVYDPAPGAGLFKSTADVSTIVKGQPLTFDLSYTNTGNVTINEAVIYDPEDPTATGAANPFATVADGGFVRLQSLAATSSKPTNVLEVYDPTVSKYVPYDGSDEALLIRSTGFRVRVTGPLRPGSTFTARFTVLTRENPDPPIGETFKNCAKIEYTPELGAPGTATACSGDVQYETPVVAGSLQKLLNPTNITRPIPGLPPQTVQVKHRIANSGNMYLKRLQFTDKDADYFDATTFAGNMIVNFPPGANRVQVDVCTTGCGTDTWINGTPNATPTLPVGVPAASVKGIRVTFSNSNGGYEILPIDDYFPKTGPCKDATFCFDTVARQFLASDPNTPIPSTLTDTSSGAGESKLQTPGQTFAIPPADASVTVSEGSPQIKLTKGPDSRLGPGDSAPFNLVIENTGTSMLVDPSVVDPLPDELTLASDVPGAPAGQPYLITYDLPAGYPEPPSAVYTPTADPGDPNRIAKVEFSFPGWTLPPGGKIKVRIDVELTPGTAPDVNITNTAGTHATNPGLACAPASPSATDDPTYGSGLYCLDSAEIVSLEGNALNAYKWSSGDPSMGFYNTGTGEVVPTDSPACPRYTFEGKVYTRFPCAAQVLPGNQIDFLLIAVNAGNNPLTDLTLVDGLPVEGDTGVLLAKQPRLTDWNNRPTMLTPVTPVESYQGISTGYTDAPFPGGLCTGNLTGGGCPAGSFDATFGPTNTGFQTTMDFPAGKYLQPGQSVTLKYAMKAPNTLQTNLDEPLAWNSFGQKAVFTTGALPASEPLKAGVGMPFGIVHVSKSVVGLPKGVTVTDFPLTYVCKIDGTVIDSGDFTLDDAESFTLPKQPVGAECLIWETDTQGASTPYDSEANAAKVVVEAALSKPEGQKVAVENSYQGGQLTVKKTVSGAAKDVAVAGGGTVGDQEYPFQVSCTFGPNGATLPNFPTTFTLKDGEEKVLNVDSGFPLPAGSNCTIDEKDAFNATTTTVVADGGEPEASTSTEIQGIKSKDVGGSLAAFDNAFESGTIEINKTLSGAASMWADGPYTFSVECTLGSTELEPIEVELSPVKLTDSVTPLPVGAVCEIRETDVGDSSATGGLIATKTVQPDSDGPVAVDADNPYPSGTLSLTKSVTGEAASLVTGAEFGVQVQCTKGAKTVVDTTVVIKDGETKSITDPIPMGSKCWGTETNTGGATSVALNFDSATNAAEVTDDSPTVALEATNTFDVAELKVRKKVTGPVADGKKFGFRVSCTMPKGGGETYTVSLPGSSSSFTLTAGELKVIQVPKGATCKTTEVSNGGATSTAITDAAGKGSDGTTVVDASSTLTYTNNFTSKLRCPLDVQALTQTQVVKRGGKTVLVYKVTTSSECRTVPPVVRCSSKARGDIRYCRTLVTGTGRVAVVTFQNGVKSVTAIVTARPRPKYEWKYRATTWTRTWRVK